MITKRTHTTVRHDYEAVISGRIVRDWLQQYLQVTGQPPPKDFTIRVPTYHESNHVEIGDTDEILVMWYTEEHLEK